MVLRRACVGCGSSVPDVGGETTLISTLGWRIHRHVGAGGELAIEWRCPACWAAFKSLERARAKR
jgi:hypothetical protein